jgi:prefoldin alpha subunit
MTEQKQEENPENSELMQQRFMHFQQLQQQIEHLTEQAEVLNQQNADLDITKEAIAQVSKTSIDNEILSGIADGIFIKTKLVENQKVIVNVGANTTVEKTIPQITEMLQQQQKHVAMKIIETQSVLGQMQEQAMQIYQQFEKEIGQQ